MSYFDRVADGWLRDAEGPYHIDPNDPGGATAWGISQRAYPNVDIASLTWKDAKVIYKRDYWDVCNCDQLPPAIAACVFDTAVLQGINPAAKILQVELKMPLIDGIIGPDTVARAYHIDPRELCKRYLSRRVKALEMTAHYAQYWQGWISRCIGLYRFAVEL